MNCHLKTNYHYQHKYFINTKTSSLAQLQVKPQSGHECLLPTGVLTQALLQQIDQCIRYEMLWKNHAGAFSTRIEKMSLQFAN